MTNDKLETKNVGTDLPICPHRKRGFTLLELLAVLVILAALATIAIPLFTNKGDEARQTAHKANIATLQKQGQAYLLEFGTPTNPDNIIPEMISKGYLKETPKYPINDVNTYAIEVVDGKAKVRLNGPVAPTLVITADKPDTTSATSITYTFTFSVPVSGFDANDITINIGTKGAFAGSGAVYTLVVTNSNLGSTQTVTVADGAATAITGGIASIGNSKSIILDNLYALGKYINFGSYNSVPIVWRIIKEVDAAYVAANPTMGVQVGDVMLVSDKIITLKAFDASGLNTYGDNYWPNSNLRKWLNSSAVTVAWGTNPAPTQSSSGVNNYSTEAGFLANFTPTDQGKIVPVNISTPTRTETYEGTPVTTEDSVFLPAESELPLLTAAGYGNYRARATQQAIDQSNYTSNPTTSLDWRYWTRTPYTVNSSCLRYVRENGVVGGIYGYAFHGDYGVRPALFLRP